MNLSKELAKQAKRHRICAEWHTRLKNLSDKPAMIEMYLAGIDFCLANDYPSNDFIRRYFKGDMESHGVFLDDSVDLTNPKKCVALGNTKGNIEVNGYSVSEIFVKNDSELSIVAKDDAFVMVDAFDNSTIHVWTYGSVNRYGNAKIHSKELDFSAIKIIEKHRKTY